MDAAAACRAEIVQTDRVSEGEQEDPLDCLQQRVILNDIPEHWSSGMDDKQHMLRHMLGSIAYRTQKSLRGAPSGFASFRPANGVRTPHQLVFHMTNVLGYARTFFVGGEWHPEMCADFQSEVERLHEMLGSLKNHIEQETPLIDMTPERMLQGQLSDAMSHVGQLAMLRRLFGSAVPPENFIMAHVDGGNTGQEQALPASPDEKWYDAEGNLEKK